jgi:hypothetical protein
MAKPKKFTKSLGEEVHPSDEGRVSFGPIAEAPALDLDHLCIRLQEFQVERKFAISLENGIVQRVSARVVRAIGLASDAGETARASAWKRAEQIVRHTFMGKAPAEADREIVDALKWQLEAGRRALEPISLFRGSVEKDMDNLAAQLPAVDLINSTPGFGLRGLAVIVGEAGNLSNYATERKLWRRLGLGVAPGHEAHAYSTWRMVKGLSADDWTAPCFPGEPRRAGYSPGRLGQIYGVVTTPLFMHRAGSKYGDVYAARRARTLVTHPEWYCDKSGKQKLGAHGAPSSAHAMEDAKRVMVKALISDLWSEWRGSEGTLNARLVVAPATQIAA